MKKNLYILISMLVFFVFVVDGVNYVPQKKQLKIVGSMGLASRNFDDYVFAPMDGVDAVYAENGKQYYVENYIQYTDTMPKSMYNRVMYFENLEPPHESLNTYTEVIEQAQYYMLLDPNPAVHNNECTRNYHNANCKTKTHVPYRMYYSEKGDFWTVIFVEKLYSDNPEVMVADRTPRGWMIAVSCKDGSLLHSSGFVYTEDVYIYPRTSPFDR